MAYIAKVILILAALYFCLLWWVGLTDLTKVVLFLTLYFFALVYWVGSLAYRTEFYKLRNMKQFFFNVKNSIINLFFKIKNSEDVKPRFLFFGTDDVLVLKSRKRNKDVDMERDQYGYIFRYRTVFEKQVVIDGTVLCSRLLKHPTRLLLLDSSNKVIDDTLEPNSKKDIEVVRQQIIVIKEGKKFYAIRKEGKKFYAVRIVKKDSK